MLFVLNIQAFTPLIRIFSINLTFNCGQLLIQIIKKKWNQIQLELVIREGTNYFKKWRFILSSNWPSSSTIEYDEYNNAMEITCTSNHSFITLSELKVFLRPIREKLNTNKKNKQKYNISKSFWRIRLERRRRWQT